MANHPNRNWRKRLDAAADQWLLTDEAVELAKPEADPVRRRAKLKAAFVFGFTAGRASVQRPARTEHDLTEAVARLSKLLEPVSDPMERVSIAYETFGRWGGEVLKALEARQSPMADLV